MTPSLESVVAQIEQALEAGPTPGEWRELHTRIDDASGYQLCHLDLHGKSEKQRDANRKLIASCNPQSIRMLLDALEDAQRDAKRYRWLRDDDRGIPDDMGEIYVTQYRLPHKDGLDVDLFGEALDAAIDKAMQEQPK